MSFKKFVTATVLFLIASSWILLKIKIEKRQTGKACSIYLYTYNNYFPEAVLKKFEEEYHCQVQYDFFANNEEAVAKLQAGATGYDVVVASDYTVKALVSSEILSKIDKNKIPNLSNISEEFFHPIYDPQSEYTVPYKWGTTSFVYNTDFIKEDLKSWDQIFQNKFKGKISLLDNQREALGIMLQRLGYSLNSINSEQLKKAQDLMMTSKSLIRVFSSDPRQLLMTGDVWIAQAYSGDGMQLKRDKAAFKYVEAKEGGVLWVDTLTIPLKSKNKDLAHNFISFILRPENEIQIVNNLFYSSPNKMLENSDISPNLKPSFIKNLDKTKFEFIEDLGIDSQKWDLIWTQVKSK